MRQMVHIQSTALWIQRERKSTHVFFLMYGCGKEEGNLPLVCLNPTAGIHKWEPLHKQSSCILGLMSTQSTTILLPLLVTEIKKIIYKASKITSTKIVKIWKLCDYWQLTIMLACWLVPMKNPKSFLVLNFSSPFPLVEIKGTLALDTFYNLHSWFSKIHATLRHLSIINQHKTMEPSKI